MTTRHSTGNSQDFPFAQTLGAGTHDVAISVLNDAFGGLVDTDRNLHVNGINIDDAALSGAAAALLNASTQRFTVNVPVHS